MKCCCCLHSIFLLLALLGFVRNSVCQQIQFSDINRNINRNNPDVSQASSSAAAIGYQTHDFDERVSDLIAANVLNFAHYVSQKLGEQSYLQKYEVFSPVSIMSSLALLILGAKGKSYDELRRVFGLNTDAELLMQPSKFHIEFGMMLEDLLRNDKGGLRVRQNAYWRQTLVGNSNARNEPVAKPKEHITRIANGIFTQNGFSLNADYKSAVNSVYHAMLTPVDFANQPTEARNIINRFVSSSTFGKIPNIITNNLPRDTNVIMASALYFKGFWEKPFLQIATLEDSFYPDGLDQPPISVQMMATSGVFPFYNAVEYDCRIIGLPYEDNVTTMYVIQPNQSSRQKLKELENLLDPSKIENMISRMTKKTARIAFPKMHLKRTINMKDTLNLLGVTEIFASGISDLSLIGSSTQAASRPVTFSRFSDIDERPAVTISSRWQDQYEDNRNYYINRQATQHRIAKRQVSALKYQHLAQLENERVQPTRVKPKLFVQDIVHQVDIEINESGTEAAAATLTSSRRSGTDVLFRAETPFMFLIRHDPTKLVTFYGIVNEPE